LALIFRGFGLLEEMVVPVHFLMRDSEIPIPSAISQVKGEDCYRKGGCCGLQHLIDIAHEI